MATLNSAHVRDNSTLTNFKDWAQSISNAFSTFGWTQSADTGQVNWSTIASVPAVNTYVYEIWEPNDGLANFFFKVEYGTNAGSSNTAPQIRLSIGTSTNGAGTLTGSVTALPVIPATSVSVTSTVTQFQCYFSGQAGRIGVLMWRDDVTNTGPLFFAVERSINGSGAYTSDYVTLLSMGASGASQGQTFQQSIVFGSGAGIAFGGSPVASNSQNGGWLVALDPAATTGLAFGSAPLALVKPSIGKDGNAMTAAGAAYGNDVTEGAIYVIAAANMPYGVSRTYLAAKNPQVNRVSGSLGRQALMMRYD